MGKAVKLQPKCPVAFDSQHLVVKLATSSVINNIINGLNSSPHSLEGRMDPVEFYFIEIIVLTTVRVSESLYCSLVNVPQRLIVESLVMVGWGGSEIFRSRGGSSSRGGKARSLGVLRVLRPQLFLLPPRHHEVDNVAPLCVPQCYILS